MVSWSIPPCSLVHGFDNFGEKYCHHLCRKNYVISSARRKTPPNIGSNIFMEFFKMVMMIVNFALEQAMKAEKGE
jgi:hypothetical protein